MQFKVHKRSLSGPLKYHYQILFTKELSPFDKFLNKQEKSIKKCISFYIIIFEKDLFFCFNAKEDLQICKSSLAIKQKKWSFYHL